MSHDSHCRHRPIERLLRAAAGLDIDKSDPLQRGGAIARSDGRDVVLPQDVPITAGLQHCIHEFRALDEDVEVRPDPDLRNPGTAECDRTFALFDLLV